MACRLPAKGLIFSGYVVGKSIKSKKHQTPKLVDNSNPEMMNGCDFALPDEAWYLGPMLYTNDA